MNHIRKIALTLIIFVCAFVGHGQVNKKESVEVRLQKIEDRIALKNLVDTFSILADVKDIPNQVLLFTENATVTSYRDGKAGATFTGRKQIGDAFAGFLKNFDVVYHINGQMEAVPPEFLIALLH